MLLHWQIDGDLAGIRDEAALAKLLEAERKAWQRLWGDVKALLERAQDGALNEPPRGQEKGRNELIDAGIRGWGNLRRAGWEKVPEARSMSGRTIPTHGPFIQATYQSSSARCPRRSATRGSRPP